jgi:hypothetical protein
MGAGRNREMNEVHSVRQSDPDGIGPKKLANFENDAGNRRPNI